MENPDQNQYEKWHQDPNNWVWGLFYFNREDDRLFLPKRTKWMGITINFANPYAVLILIVIIGLIAILPSHK